MKIWLLLLLTSLSGLLPALRWQPAASTATATRSQTGTAAGAGLAVLPDAGHKGWFRVRLPAPHGALQVSVLDAQGHPVQPPQLVAAATSSLTLDAHQWPAGRYQLLIRSASGLISTSLHVH